MTSPEPLKLLFVCVENSCRSQMAEAFARRLGGERVEAHSAGSKPSGEINPKALMAMAAIGHDMSAHRSKGLDEIPDGPYAAVVTMGCGDACPHVESTLNEDWAIPQPKDMEPGPFAGVRDMIEAQMRDLLTRLGVALQ